MHLRQASEIPAGHAVAGAADWCVSATAKFAFRVSGRDYLVCATDEGGMELASDGFVARTLLHLVPLTYCEYGCGCTAVARGRRALAPDTSTHPPFLFMADLEDVDTSVPTSSPFAVPTNVTSGLPLQCPEIQAPDSATERR